MERKPNILVVDNERGLIGTAREALGTTFEVTVASSLKQGLEKAKREKPDLIILGYLEPRGTSFQLHNKLREEPLAKNIPLVVVDVRPEEHSRKGWRRDEGLQMDAEDYMSQPLESDELKETVDRILQKVRSKPMELTEVLEQIEVMLKRMDKIEKLLVK